MHDVFAMLEPILKGAQFLCKHRGRLHQLFVFALGSPGILYGLLRVEYRQSTWWYRLAVPGCVLYCWQTVALDAIVWTYYFPA